MNGKSSNVHVTSLLNFPSGDQGRLPGGSWWGWGVLCQRGCSRQKGQPVQRFGDQAAFYSLGELEAGWRSEGEGWRSGGRRGRQVSRAQFTHCQGGLDFALSRREDRAWDQASEARQRAKEPPAELVPLPPAAYCCVGFGQVASSFLVLILSSV